MGQIIKASTQITTQLVLKKLAEVNNTFMFLKVKSNKLKNNQNLSLICFYNNIMISI